MYIPTSYRFLHSFFFIYKKFGIAYVVFFGCHAVESDHLIYWNWTQFDFFFFISLVREWVLVRCRRKKTLLALMYIYRRVCEYIFRLVYTIHCIAHISGFAAQGIRRNVRNIWSFFLFFFLFTANHQYAFRFVFLFFMWLWQTINPVWESIPASQAKYINKFCVLVFLFSLETATMLHTISRTEYI